MKTAKIGDFLTAAELDRAVALYERLDREGATHHFAAIAAEKIIAPVLHRINEKLGQENDAKYLAYGLEYAIRHGATKGGVDRETPGEG